MTREQGSITVLTVGFLVFLSLLTVVVVNASAAFLAQQRLSAVADGAALAASAGLAEDVFYRSGRVVVEEGAAVRMANRSQPPTGREPLACGATR